MYVYRNIKVRLRNHCCRGKAISITCVCVCVCVCVGVGARAQACGCAHIGLFIQYATRKRHVVCLLCGSTTL